MSFSPTLPWFQLVGIALVNALGYVIFRASETQRCEFAKDPNSPSLKRKLFVTVRVANPLMIPLPLFLSCACFSSNILISTDLDTLPTAGGKKLLISGWWGLVRHPNYLGEILIQWSWVLPAGKHKCGVSDCCKTNQLNFLCHPESLPDG